MDKYKTNFCDIKIKTEQVCKLKKNQTKIAFFEQSETLYLLNDHHQLKVNSSRILVN
jgi:hypothetical protein